MRFTGRLQFCDLESLPESRFYFWRREIARRDREWPPRDAGASRRAHAAASAPAAFVPIDVIGDERRRGAGPLEVVLPSGATLRVPAGFDRETLSGVISLLEHRDVPAAT